MKTYNFKTLGGGALRPAVLLCLVAGLVHPVHMSLAGPPPGPSSGGLPAPPLPSSPGSPETAALLKRLISLADDKSVGAQEDLARQLASAATLDTLDAPRERAQRTPSDLRVARVFDRLRQNQAPAAAKTLLALTHSQAIRDDWRLQSLLIRAFGSQRPLQQESVDFLDVQSHTKSLNLQIVISTLIENESAVALALLGSKLADSGIDDNNKISWIRYQILPKRRTVPVLRGIEKWLSEGKLGVSIRNALMDALFDYRPREWGAEDLPAPPKESATSADAVEILRRIGKVVTVGNYPASIQSAASRTLGKLP